MNIQGYSFVRRDREGRRGGGIAFYVNSRYRPDIVEIDCEQISIEQMWITIRFSTYNVAFAVFYRPPGTNINSALERFDEVLSFVLPSVDYVVCLGDINVNLFNLNNPVTNCFDSYGFHQVIDEPTRITESTATLLDPIFVSERRAVYSSGIINADRISDHMLTFCEIKIRIDKFVPKMVKYRDFKHFDPANFSVSLRSLPWHDLVYEPNIDTKVSMFTNMILSLFDIFAPIKTVRVTKPKAPWLTAGIKFAMKQRDLAMARFRSTKSLDDYNTYKRLRNSTVNLVRNAKKEHINSIVRENNARKTWKSLSSLDIKRKRQGTVPEYLSNVNDINDYFVSVFNDGGCDELVSFYNSLDSVTRNKLFFRLATTEEVNKALNGIKSNASGSDGISLYMLQCCSPFIDPYLTHIVNVCLENGYFPDAWKVSLIHPVPKVTVPESFSDLRPVSLLPVVSKILERIVYDQINNHICDLKIIPENQSGFRKGHNTSSTLSGVLDDIVGDLDSGMVSIMVLLDFSKAFDTINYNLLCAKLRYYGFSEVALNFITTYLFGRTQKVVIADRASSIQPVASGVPQGSILGPLLFIIYTADILNSIRLCSYKAYADDTQLHYSFQPYDYHAAEYIVNRELGDIFDCAGKHNLMLNPNKSMVVMFGGAKAKRLSECLNINVNNTKIPIKQSAKSLGLIFDSQLTFIENTNSLLKKAYFSLKILYSNKHLLSRRLRKMLVESLVLSNFNYCNFVYGPFLNMREQQKIQKVQNSCVRFIFGLRKYDHISQQFRDLSWLSMSSRRELHFAVFVRKVLLTSSPSYLCSKLVSRSNIHSVNTRHRELLAIPRHATALFRRGFAYQAVHFHNKLPIELKGNIGIYQFKKSYRRLLLQNQSN